MSSASRKPSSRAGALPTVRRPQRAGGAGKGPTATSPCKRCSRAPSLPAVSPPPASKAGRNKTGSPILKRPTNPSQAESSKVETTTPVVKAPAEKGATTPSEAVHPSPEGRGGAAPGPDSAAEDLRLAEEEALALKAERGNGAVRVVYEMYNEEFSILNGSTTQEAIDEEYALSFVMPQCRVHLSTLAPSDKRNADIAGVLDIFVKEEPPGTYQGLERGCMYYVYVEQEAMQLEREQAVAQRRAEQTRGLAEQEQQPDVERDDGRVLESCSCIYGNPCLVRKGGRMDYSFWILLLICAVRPGRVRV